jgi:multidrug resistance protein, MATE family
MTAASLRTEIRPTLALAVPITVGLSASMLLSVTDSVMVAPLGAAPLAAVGLTGAAALIVQAAVWGLIAQISVRVAGALGAGQGRRVPVILRSGLWLGLAAGVAGAAVMGLVWLVLPWLGQPPEVLAILGPYWALIALTIVPMSVLFVFKAVFEAVGRAWLATAIAFGAVVVNVPLNYALIWGVGPLPALGLTGAGVATLVAETLALGVAVLWWQLAPSLRRWRIRAPATAGDLVATAREGAPLGALYVAETGAMAIATMLIGTFGAVALAGNQVAMSVGGVLYMVPLGVAGAVAIRIGAALGAGDRARLRPIAFAALGLVTLWLVAAAIVLALFGRNIAAMISDDPQVIAVAASIFVIFALSQVADGVQSTMLGALRGLSDTAVPGTVSLIGYWAVGLPVGWWLAGQGGLGPAGIWAGFVVGVGVVGALLVWRFLRQTGLSPLAPAV